MKTETQTYREKIHGYTLDTLNKITRAKTSEEKALKVHKIVTEAKTEQEVLKKLKKLAKEQ